MITNRLRKLREQRMQTASNPSEWTQEGLAFRVGVSRQTIIAIEQGKYAPSLNLAFRIARAFNTTIENVFQFQENQITE